jgi:hypothetical protein
MITIETQVNITKKPNTHTTQVQRLQFNPKAQHVLENKSKRIRKGVRDKNRNLSLRSLFL